MGSDFGSTSDDSLGAIHSATSFAVHDAAEAGNVERLRELLAAPAAREDPDFDPQKDEKKSDASLGLDEAAPDGCTPLHVSIINGHLACCELLLEAGADPGLPCEGCPLLSLAVCQGALPEKRQFAKDAVAFLLGKQCSPFDRDDSGRTALHWAASLGLCDIADMLLRAPPEAMELQLPPQADGTTGDDLGVVRPDPLVELQDRWGDTPLHLAAMHRCPQMVKLLVGGGEGWSAEGALHTGNKMMGSLPIHCAASSGCCHCAEALATAAESTLSAQDRRGRIPHEVAAARGHKELSLLLQKRFKQGLEVPALPVPLPTLLLTHPDFFEHHTMHLPLSIRNSHAPPENVGRLHVLLRKDSGILWSSEFEGLQWDMEPPLAEMADVLRVHDWTYVNQIKLFCQSLPQSPVTVGRLDSDTALSHGSFRAALRAAGAACKAVDALVTGKARNAFCAVRPPGHHAGPLGKVTCKNDPTGSSGFCLLNTIAIAAAYALNIHRHNGIKKVAILDFDVHHGNGTEALIEATVPHQLKVPLKTPFSEGIQLFPQWRPWLGEADSESIFFASTQAYGSRIPGIEGAWFYPGSGATCDTQQLRNGQGPTDQPQANSTPAQGVDGKAMDEAKTGAAQQPGSVGNNADDHMGHPGGVANGDEEGPFSCGVEEDPDGEFSYCGGEVPRLGGPRIVNVGIPGPGVQAMLWKRAWRDKILPAVVNFDPDLIFVSAGFDAHRKDDINDNFVGLLDRHYEWVTDQIVQVANRCCGGRVVSALEGGYRIQGGIVSAFARCVAAHVRALMDTHTQAWDPSEGKWERTVEHARRERRKCRQEGMQDPAKDGSAEPPVANNQGEGPGATAQPEIPEGASDGATQTRPERKRRRVEVDYTALQEQMEREASQKS
eukprot:evm.model.scf_177.4 EVM.evm.TU.scf_177.4   scf_177:18001-33099(-)